tara:strand:- start:973 stop:1161 length:189 start_codon:yes stop_codon:yes gene_type:complete
VIDIITIAVGAVVLIYLVFSRATRKEEDSGEKIINAYSAYLENPCDETNENLNRKMREINGQ